MAPSRLLGIAALGFFLAVIVTVFWQIETDFKAQGIADGGPYDNAAAFPWIIAMFMGGLIGVQLLLELLKSVPRVSGDSLAPSDRWRAILMLGVFAIYLMVMTTVGYHLATAPMIAAIMWICGMRNILKIGVASVAIATGFAFIFEVFLNVVLPLGIWGIFIPW